jgi:hypothetical protein
VSRNDVARLDLGRDGTVGPNLGRVIDAGLDLG